MACIVTPDLVAAGDTITAAFHHDGNPIDAPYPLAVRKVERYPFAEFYALVCGAGVLELEARATVEISN